MSVSLFIILVFVTFFNSSHSAITFTNNANTNTQPSSPPLLNHTLRLFYISLTTSFFTTPPYLAQPPHQSQYCHQAGVTHYRSFCYRSLLISRFSFFFCFLLSLHLLLTLRRLVHQHHTFHRLLCTSLHIVCFHFTNR